MAGDEGNQDTAEAVSRDQGVVRPLVDGCGLDGAREPRRRPANGAGADDEPGNRYADRARRLRVASGDTHREAGRRAEDDHPGADAGDEAHGKPPVQATVADGSDHRLLRHRKGRGAVEVRGIA